VSAGIGGAPLHPVSMPRDAEARKNAPVFSGVMRYFPDALVAVAQLSKKGNDQHNPGKPLHWDRSKSGDEGDALIRHQLEAGTLDFDGQRHSAKVAWRALAQLQKEIEAEHATAAAPLVPLPEIGELRLRPDGEWRLRTEGQWRIAFGQPLVADGTLVEVQFRDGTKTTGQVQDFYWKADLADATIEKWRVI